MNGCREPDEDVLPTTLPGVGSYVWHVAEDRLVWSPELVRMYGLGEAPAAERGFGDLLHPDDRVRVEAETLGFMESGSTYQHEFRIVRPDGRVRVMHDRGVIERAPDGRVLALRGMNVDVTDQRLAHQAAGGERDRDAATDREVPFALFLRQIPAAIAVFDRDMHYIAVSRQYREDYRLGHHARIAGLSLLDVFPDVPPARRDAHRRALAGTISDEAVTVRHSDGTSDVMRVRIAPWRTPDGRIGGVVLTSSVITGEVEARRRVEASEERLRFVTERAAVGHWHWELGADRLEWSAESARLFGISPEAPMSYAHFLAAVHPDDRGRTDAAVRACLDGGGGIDYDVEYRTLWADGTVRWIHAKGSATFADGRPIRMAGIAHDITDRKQAEQALHENEQRLQLAYDATGIGAWDVDLLTGRAVWSPKLYDLLGLGAELPASQELFFRHVHPEDQSRLHQELDAAVAAHAPFAAEFLVVRADGAIRHLAGEGRVVAETGGRAARMIGVNYDITARREAEEALRAGAVRLKRILDGALGLVWVLEPTGALVEANLRALSLAGLERDHVLGRAIWAAGWWEPEGQEAERLRDAVSRAAAGEQVRYESSLPTPAEDPMVLDLNLSPLCDADGKASHIVVSGFDVTEHKRTQERNAFLLREMSHRTKNILALVQAVARQTARVDAPDFLERFIQRVQGLAAQQDLLVNNGWQEVMLHDLVRSQLLHFADLVDRRIVIRGPAVLVSDVAAQPLAMALHELATNAGKYGALSNADGRVEIAWALLGTEAEEPRFEIGWVERDGPPVAPPQRSGFGSTVIDGKARVALAASVEVSFAPEGFRWRLACAAERLRSAPDW